MKDVLQVKLRKETGTGRMRRMRKQGMTPAVLYGHGEENVHLALPTAEVEAALRHGGKMLDLSGDLAEKALVRAVQWDAFGVEILHVDLSRVSETESVVVTVPVELRGEAPGAKQGGIVEHHLFDAEIRCPAGQIPEKLSISIKELEVGQSLTLGDVVLPENVETTTPDDTVVVSCQAPALTEEEEGEGAVEGAAEPEVIGRKAEEGEEGSE